MKSFFLLLAASLSIFLISCKKEAGEGGTSNIKGKVYAKYYDKYFFTVADAKYAPDEDVYIIYGNESTFGERQRTSQDGSYAFNFLRTGTYKIYAYSRDSSGAYKNQVNPYSPDVAVIQTVEITKRRQTVEVTEIQIVK